MIRYVRAMRFAVVVPVGPDPDDPTRLKGLTESLCAHVGSTATLVLIDDSGESRELDRHVTWPDGEVIVIPAPVGVGDRLPNDRMAASTLTYLRWLAGSNCSYAIKLDTDALVIGDFRPALERAFADPELGVCGACERNTADGALRDLTLWRRQLVLACFPVQPRLGSGRPRLVLAISGRRARQRRFLRRALLCARRHGYRLGEHCLGGAYAVSARAARAATATDALADPCLTAGTGLGEDVILGLLVRAAGFRLCSLVAPGEPFALRHHGLLASPKVLVERGHTVVHSVKSPDPHVERELRETFVKLRDAGSAPGSDPDLSPT